MPTASGRGDGSSRGLPLPRLVPGPWEGLAVPSSTPSSSGTAPGQTHWLSRVQQISMTSKLPGAVSTAGTASPTRDWGYRFPVLCCHIPLKAFTGAFKSHRASTKEQIMCKSGCCDLLSPRTLVRRTKRAAGQMLRLEKASQEEPPLQGLSRVRVLPPSPPPTGRPSREDPAGGG